jgi:hypothetical protein
MIDSGTSLDLILFLSMFMFLLMIAAILIPAMRTSYLQDKYKRNACPNCGIEIKVKTHWDSWVEPMDCPTCLKVVPKEHIRKWEYYTGRFD